MHSSKKGEQHGKHSGRLEAWIVVPDGATGAGWNVAILVRDDGLYASRDVEGDSFLGDCDIRFGHSGDDDELCGDGVDVGRGD